MNKITLESAKGMVNVFYDGLLQFSVHHSLVRDYGVRDGDEMSPEDFARFRDTCVYKQCLSRAGWLLTRRDYCSAALFKKLGGDETAARVVAELIEDGMLDDEDYARRRAEWLLQQRLYSPDKTVYTMVGEGIDRDLARRVVDELADDTQNTLQTLIEKKYLRKLAEPDGARKVTASLLRMGFEYGAVREALREYTQED